MNARIPLFLSIVLIVSCQHHKKQLSFYDEDAPVEDTTSLAQDSTSQPQSAASPQVVSIPFTEQGGVKFVDVKINRTIGVNMILDSGCSGTLISVDEANYLYKKGVLAANDIKGITQAQIADGSIVENMVINLREIVIGGQIVCPNVEATVSANSGAPLLLGNEVLNRIASYTVDNEHKVINFALNN